MSKNLLRTLFQRQWATGLCYPQPYFQTRFERRQLCNYLRGRGREGCSAEWDPSSCVVRWLGKPISMIPLEMA